MQITVLGRLTAADDRKLKGLLLPFGVAGHTNRGRVVAAAGCLNVPVALGPLNCSLDHLDDRDDVARFASVTQTKDGYAATWDVPKTHGGDKLLAEFRDGKRTGVSVELDPYTVQDGKLLSATLVGCAFPVEPAFDTARLTAALVPDTTDELQADFDATSVTESVDTYTDPETGETVTVTTRREVRESSETEVEDSSEPDNKESTVPPAATAPNELSASAASRNGRLTAGSIKKPADLFKLLAQAHAKGDRRLLAALSDITATSLTDRDVPAWVGELWSGIPYQRRIVPLVGHGVLTSMTVKGWRWVTKPVMGPYAGDKTAVPSGPVTTEPVEVAAERLAGAHDIDRKYRDFNDADFFASYYQAMAESYAKLSDAALAEDLKGAAGAPISLGAVPAGISAEWAALVDAALSIVPVGAPTFSLVESSVYRALVLTPKDKAFEFLSASLGLEDGALDGFKIVPVATTAVGTASATGLDKGEILVGAKQSATFHELGGGAPIRAEALDMTKAGVDVGCFGYYATVVHDERALALADLTADV